MVQYQTHIMRRFCLHDTAPNINLKTLRIELNEANQLNAESRQTFALLADLTTFIHVADILRINLRDKPEVSLIELKTGTINHFLLSALEGYEPTPASFDRIITDPNIEEQHKKQAKRMLAQKIRVSRVAEIISKDEGIDPKREIPISHSQDMIFAVQFDELLKRTCDSARAEGFGASSVNWCFHLGVGYSQDPEKARRNAIIAVNHALAIENKKRPEGFDSIEKEVTENVGLERENNYVLIDLVENNLHAIATRPFLLWEVTRPHVFDMISRNLRVLAVFDLRKFLWLARHEGVQIKFASRGETQKAKEFLSSLDIATWANRGLVYQYGEMEVFLTTGLLSHIIHDLTSPLQIIREMLIPKDAEVQRVSALRNKLQAEGKKSAEE